MRRYPDTLFAGDCGLSLAPRTRLFAPGNSDQSRPNSSHARRMMRASRIWCGPPSGTSAFSPLTMNRHVRMTCAALLLVSVEAATVLGQPFVKRRAFHRLSPVPDANSLCSYLGAPVNMGIYAGRKRCVSPSLESCTIPRHRRANGGSCGKEKQDLV
jgi:hypothetical protein